MNTRNSARPTCRAPVSFATSKGRQILEWNTADRRLCGKRLDPLPHSDVQALCRVYLGLPKWGKNERRPKAPRITSYQALREFSQREQRRKKRVARSVPAAEYTPPTDAVPPSVRARRLADSFGANPSNLTPSDWLLISLRRLPQPTGPRCEPGRRNVWDQLLLRFYLHKLRRDTTEGGEGEPTSEQSHSDVWQYSPAKTSAQRIEPKLYHVHIENRQRDFLGRLDSAPHSPLWNSWAKLDYETAYWTKFYYYTLLSPADLLHRYHNWVRTADHGKSASFEWTLNADKAEGWSNTIVAHRLGESDDLGHLSGTYRGCDPGALGSSKKSGLRCASELYEFQKSKRKITRQIGVIRKECERCGRETLHKSPSERDPHKTPHEEPICIRCSWPRSGAPVPVFSPPWYPPREWPLTVLASSLTPVMRADAHLAGAATRGDGRHASAGYSTHHPLRSPYVEALREHSRLARIRRTERLDPLARYLSPYGALHPLAEQFCGRGMPEARKCPTMFAHSARTCPICLWRAWSIPFGWAISHRRPSPPYNVLHSLDISIVIGDPDVLAFLNPREPGPDKRDNTLLRDDAKPEDRKWLADHEKDLEEPKDAPEDEAGEPEPQGKRKTPPKGQRPGWLKDGEPALDQIMAKVQQAREASELPKSGKRKRGRPPKASKTQLVEMVRASPGETVSDRGRAWLKAQGYADEKIAELLPAVQKAVSSRNEPG